MPMSNPSLRAMIDPRAQFGEWGRDAAATAGVGLPQGAMGNVQTAGPGLAGAQPTPPTPAEMQAGGSPAGMIGQGAPMGMDPGLLQMIITLSNMDPQTFAAMLEQLPEEQQMMLYQLYSMINPGAMGVGQEPVATPEMGMPQSPAMGMPQMGGALGLG